MTPLRNRPLDAFLVFWFSLFAVSSLIFEPFIVFGVDLSSATDPVGRTWYWYARSFDPVFLETPLWLRIMCGIDAFIFGPFYLILIYALTRARNWIRTPALLYGAAIVYSTLVYFGYELFDPVNRAQANLPMVFLINIPYTLVPLLLLWRMKRAPAFGGAVFRVSSGVMHAQEFAEWWVAAWSNRDVDAIAARFAEDVRFVSPRAAQVTGDPLVVGRAALRDYWHRAVANVESIVFTLDYVLEDARGKRLVIVYTSDIDGRRRRACELIELDDVGEIIAAEAMHGCSLP